jgi:type I restriction enzyme S subunit
MPLGVMASRKFALPPLDEQSEIVDFVEAKLGKFDVLKEEAEAGILLLKERRSALIAAAVTGKIDVRQTA